MSAQAPKKIPPIKKKSAVTKWLPQSKKVLEGVWGNLFLKKVPPRNKKKTIFCLKEDIDRIHG